MKLKNPRGYLSYTQIDMWRRNKQRYIANYIMGEDRTFTNSGIEHGKKTSEALETGEAGGDAIMEAVLALLPHYSEREYEMRVTMRTKDGEVDLLGKLDTFDPKKLRIREYKTSRNMWTQKQAQRHPQLHHYATMIYLKYGKLPTECWLDCIETEEGDEGVRFTGNIQSFHVKIGLTEVLEYMSLANRVAREIDAEYRHQLKRLA